MIFCGQCGLQLAPGTIRCPRCGAQVESSDAPAAGDLHSDDATVASPSLLARNPAKPNTPPPLVLRSGPDNGDFGTQAANPNYGTQMPTHQQMGTSYAGYPPQQASYPDYSTHGAGVYPTQGMQSQMGMGYTQPYEEEESSSHGKLRVAALVVILLGLLLILSAVALFALQRKGIIAGGNHSGGSPTTVVATTAPQAPTLTVIQQAQTVIQQYYADINAQNYQDAYHLWKHNPDSYTTFSSGFKNTKQDQVQINQTAQQQDGTVKLTVTVVAMETSPTGDKHSTYTGYYIVGQQSDTSWKIIDAMLQSK